VEVQALVGSVNRMLDRLQLSVETLREFAGDAAHELRTPLAILMLGIGSLPDGETKTKLTRDAQRMKRLVDQMLDMAQASTVEIAADDRVDSVRWRATFPPTCCRSRWRAAVRSRSSMQAARRSAVTRKRSAGRCAT
jgi:signal transduction histidine kinase